MVGTNNEGGSAHDAAVNDADARVLDDLLAAAGVEPPEDPAEPFNHYLTDGLVERLQKPSVRAVLVRLTPLLLPDANERREIAAAVDPRVRAAWSDPLGHGYEWWHADRRDRAAYLRRRLQVVALLRALHARATPEPWLPIDEAADKAAVSAWKVRKWPNRKRDPLPVLGDDGQPLLLEERSGRKPVKPFRVRCSDVRAWDEKARARARDDTFCGGKHGNTRQPSCGAFPGASRPRKGRA